MKNFSNTELNTLSEAYAFLGNSLLKPMSMTSDIGLDPAFWEAFPDFDDKEVSDAKDALAQWASSQEGAENPVQDVSYQYTKLFVGPPSPAAAPWETMYRGKDGQEVTVGFGEPTFLMRKLLRDAGLELSNENNQYEDHIGIELLYLSELCRRAASGASEEADEATDTAADALQAIDEFVRERPLSWIDGLQAKVQAAFPDGYYSLLLSLAQSLLKM